MFRSLQTVIVFVAAMALSSAWASAGDFELTLNVSAGSQNQSAQTPKSAASRPSTADRPALTVSAGEKCVVAYKVTSVARQLLENALVHCFVVRIEKAGNPPPPLDPKLVILESALTMDFPTGSSTHAELELRPQRPGVYLVQIEASNGPEESERRASIAVDLIVK